MTDPITDMFNRIRNAQAVSKEKVHVPFSNLKFEISKVIKKEGFIEGIKKKKKKKKKMLEIELRYDKEGSPAILGVERVSKPGQRIYKKSSSIPYVKGGYGVSIVSTPQGVMTGKKARKMNLGGEILVKIW